ncbi:MAG: ATP-binding protein [Anaerolineales bacterium]|jgi:MinD superfamily P-loop ATPase
MALREMDPKTKQLVILSGKGGTGKTCVAAALAHLASISEPPLKAVLADADVDAANLELISKPRRLDCQPFYGGQTAVIEPNLCSGCGLCSAVCRFDAISSDNGAFQVNPFACDGCAACFFQCPENAIKMQAQTAGEWFQSESQFGPLFHAELTPAQENSGKLVTLIKQQARLLAMDESRELVIVDGPPGIGCPVISAASGADYALIVTEPSRSGAADLSRVLKTTAHFGINALVCINKAGLFPPGEIEIETLCREQDIPIAGRIPFDPAVVEGMTQAEPVTVYAPQSPASVAIRAVWSRIRNILWGYS